MPVKSRWFPALCLLTLATACTSVRADDNSKVSILVTDSHIDFLVSRELVARYNKGSDVVKPYLWPLYGPHGEPMTRAWPMEKATPGESTDHVHQKSVWFCHGDVIPEGLPLKNKPRGVDGVDFWSEGKAHGGIVCTHVGEPEHDKDHARIETRNEWRTADGVKILDEVGVIHFYEFGDARMFVFDINLHASVRPIIFGDTKEGSFGVRVNDQIREAKGNGKIENADGKVGERACWGQQSAWCDYSGAIAGKTVGLAILDHPANPYPACWHSRGYGLMAANPFGRAKSGFPAMKGKTSLVRLAQGEYLRLRYGLLVHLGNAKEGRVTEYFERFVRLAG
jgi:hypothetical protein